MERQSLTSSRWQFIWHIWQSLTSLRRWQLTSFDTIFPKTPWFSFVMLFSSEQLSIQQMLTACSIYISNWKLLKAQIWGGSRPSSLLSLSISCAAASISFLLLRSSELQHFLVNSFNIACLMQKIYKNLLQHFDWSSLLLALSPLLSLCVVSLSSSRLPAMSVVLADQLPLQCIFEKRFVFA